MSSDIRSAHSGARYLLVSALCVTMAAACGSVSATGAAGGGGAGSAPKVSLHATVTGPQGTTSRHWTLRCDPAGGTHPHPAAACRILLAARNPFAPLPRHMMCPMIAVGAKQAVVTGTWFGKKVQATFTDGGCYLQRWAKIGQIFN